MTRIAERYERVMVPAVGQALGAALLEEVGLAPGARVLDVACGTGIVARLAAPRLGAGGRMVAVDNNEAMLSVARLQPLSTGVPIEWQQADAASLPFPDGSFDVVLCQLGLQFFPQRLIALRQMKRVLVPAGQLGLSVWVQSAAYEVFEGAVAPCVGEQAARSLRDPFSLSGADELSDLLGEAGFRDVRMETKTIIARFPSAYDFFGYQLSGRLAPAVDRLTDDTRGALIDALQHAFEPFANEAGCAFPMEARVARATK